MSTQLAISKPDVDKARRALSGMRGSLAKWLKYRQINDDAIAGRIVSTKLPQKAAAQVSASGRDPGLEQRLADQLYALLAEIVPEQQLPGSDLRKDPTAAVRLAKLAIGGVDVATQQVAPTATGSVWLSWPVLVVGGLLLAITFKIQSDADVAAEKERYACIQAGNCTDYGFWLKAGGILFIGWFAWEKMGLGKKVTDLVGGMGAK